MHLRPREQLEYCILTALRPRPSSAIFIFSFSKYLSHSKNFPSRMIGPRDTSRVLRFPIAQNRKFYHLVSTRSLNMTKWLTRNLARVPKHNIWFGTSAISKSSGQACLSNQDLTIYFLVGKFQTIFGNLPWGVLSLTQNRISKVCLERARTLLFEGWAQEQPQGEAPTQASG